MKLILRLTTIAIALFFVTAPGVGERLDKYLERQNARGKSPKVKEKFLDIITDPKPLTEQTQHFPIGIELVDAKNTKKNTFPSIKGINLFKVKRLDAADQDALYTVMYFIDEIPIEIFQSLPLPFVLKRDYRGLSKGMHTLSFKVVDQNDNIGIASINIIINH